MCGLNFYESDVTKNEGFNSDSLGFSDFQVWLSNPDFDMYGKIPVEPVVPNVLKFDILLSEIDLTKTVGTHFFWHLWRPLNFGFVFLIVSWVLTIEGCQIITFFPKISWDTKTLSEEFLEKPFIRNFSKIISTLRDLCTYYTSISNVSSAMTAGHVISRFLETRKLCRELQSEIRSTQRFTD